MDERSFWYAIAQSHEIKRNNVISRKLLGEAVALFRDANGEVAALRDRCMHRNAPLSAGSVKCGQVRCRYHGWTYNGDGSLADVPSEGSNVRQSSGRRARAFAAQELDGLIYVCLAECPAVAPYRNPHWEEKGWDTVRLVNRFKGDINQCIENAIDVPHTSYVHQKLFREPRRQKLRAALARADGEVTVDFHGETDNLGPLKRFLNPRADSIRHRDRFISPNITIADYVMGPSRALYIVSHHVPGDDDNTMMVTDLSYNYGVVNRLPGLRTLIRGITQAQARIVLRQDKAIVEHQSRALARYGRDFHHAPADAIHVMIKSLREALAEGIDPKSLPVQEANIQLWV